VKKYFLKIFYTIFTWLMSVACEAFLMVHETIFECFFTSSHIICCCHVYKTRL